MSPDSGDATGTGKAFEFTATEENRFVAGNIGDPSVRDVVYGGQLLAQMILASDRVAADKDVASIHTIFARSARVSSPIEIDVDVIHDGRTVGSHSVTVHQGDRVCAQGLVLRRLDAPDLIRHQPEMPQVAGPDDSPDTGQAGLLAPGSDLRVVGGLNTWDPDAPVGPAELFAWSGFRPTPVRPATRPWPRPCWPTAPMGSSSGRPCFPTPASARTWPIATSAPGWCPIP